MCHNKGLPSVTSLVIVIEFEKLEREFGKPNKSSIIVKATRTRLGPAVLRGRKSSRVTCVRSIVQ
jgi:hypothetical protein